MGKFDDAFYEALEVDREKTRLGMMPVKPTPPRSPSEAPREAAHPDTPFVLIPFLQRCSRCGGSHQELMFFELSTPIFLRYGVVLYTHWALCPTNGEPILNRVINGRMTTLPYPP